MSNAATTILVGAAVSLLLGCSDSASSTDSPAPAAFTACVEHYQKDHDDLGNRMEVCEPFLQADTEDGEGLQKVAEDHFQMD